LETHQSALRARSPFASKAIRLFTRHRHCRAGEDIQAQVELFVPNSIGNVDDLTDLTLAGIERIVPLLSELAGQRGGKELETVTADRFCARYGARASADALGALFIKYGSDKASFHNYHLVYGAILQAIAPMGSMLEIGLGTNNTDVISNMGSVGKPGASARAFRDFNDRAIIYGADVDRRVLFVEDRIQTFYVDQMRPDTLASLREQIGHDLDLIIDDGLHSPAANLAVLLSALKSLRVGGWLVIEDIPYRARAFWHVVHALMPETFDNCLVEAKSALMFVSQRRA
jgi:hypothetical protein